MWRLQILQWTEKRDRNRSRGRIIKTENNSRARIRAEAIPELLLQYSIKKAIWVPVTLPHKGYVCNQFLLLRYSLKKMAQKSAALCCYEEPIPGSAFNFKCHFTVSHWQVKTVKKRDMKTRDELQKQVGQRRKDEWKTKGGQYSNFSNNNW